MISEQFGGRIGRDVASPLASPCAIALNKIPAISPTQLVLSIFPRMQLLGGDCEEGGSELPVLADRVQTGR